MINVLFSASGTDWAEYEGPLRAAFADAGLEVTLSRDHPPAKVDYIVHAPSGGLVDFAPFTRAKAVLSLWAGVENIVANPTLELPLTRMVDQGMTEGMVEWVVAHVLRHHIGMDAHIVNPQLEWAPKRPPLARQRDVGILGLGTLGTACAEALAALNFRVHGWARSAKTIDGVTCRSGEAGLAETLAAAEILVLLLPLTEATESLLNADRLALLPKGAVVLNPGRGALIDDTALLDALDEGRIDHATLDVFREEPLPKDHPFWTDPKVTVTPHVASETRPETSAGQIAENIRRGEAGEPLLHLVDRSAGY